MAESHEPSYYEIALTNRQVIVAFVILLVCLLSAFFSGVWIGRESTARAAAEQMVRNAPPPELTPEGKNLDELEFFDARNKQKGDRSGKPSEDAQATPPSSTDTTLLEDFAGTEPPSKAAPAPPADEAESKPAVQRGQGEDETNPAAPEPDRKGKRNKRNRANEQAAAATPAVPKGSVVIQVFSSPERSQADRIRDRLVGGGYQAYLSPVEVGGHTMYRVRIGPFGSRDDAQSVAEKVRKGYKLDTWVTE